MRNALVSPGGIIPDSDNIRLVPRNNPQFTISSVSPKMAKVSLSPLIKCTVLYNNFSNS